MREGQNFFFAKNEEKDLFFIFLVFSNLFFSLEIAVFYHNFTVFYHNFTIICRSWEKPRYWKKTIFTDFYRFYRYFDPIFTRFWPVSRPKIWILDRKIDFFRKKHEKKWIFGTNYVFQYFFSCLFLGFFCIRPEWWEVQKNTNFFVFFEARFFGFLAKV